MLSRTLIFLAQVIIEFSGLPLLSVAVIPQTAGAGNLVLSYLKDRRIFTFCFNIWDLSYLRSVDPSIVYESECFADTRVYQWSPSITELWKLHLCAISLIATSSQLISLSHWYLVLPHLSLWSNVYLGSISGRCSRFAEIPLQSTCQFHWMSPGGQAIRETGS